MRITYSQPWPVSTFEGSQRNPTGSGTRRSAERLPVSTSEGFPKEPPDIRGDVCDVSHGDVSTSEKPSGLHLASLTLRGFDGVPTSEVRKEPHLTAGKFVGARGFVSTFEAPKGTPPEWTVRCCIDGLIVSTSGESFRTPTWLVDLGVPIELVSFQLSGSPCARWGVRNRILSPFPTSFQLSGSPFGESFRTPHVRKDVRNALQRDVSTSEESFRTPHRP